MGGGSSLCFMGLRSQATAKFMLCSLLLAWLPSHLRTRWLPGWMGFAGLLQNGSHILLSPLSPLRHLSSVSPQNRMAKRRWRGSRMCDPFCNNPANHIQTDSHLDQTLDIITPQAIGIMGFILPRAFWWCPKASTNLASKNKSSVSLFQRLSATSLSGFFCRVEKRRRRQSGGKQRNSYSPRVSKEREDRYRPLF